jgi:3-hydroxyisobutyrate dehydrogenase
MKIAWLGTGIMGAPMARHVAQAGNEVIAWNRTREKAQGIDGVEVADSPQEAVRDAEVLVTMLADGDAVEEVVGQLTPDSDVIWWQASTVGIEATERLRQRGFTYVDAPVLGTKQPAEEGKLTVLASGPDEARERCDPIFDAVAQKAVWLGDAGTGTRMKLVINSWLLSLVEGLAETIAFAEGIDIDPSQFLDAISGGPIDNPYAQMKGRMMVERSFEPSFKLELAAKDARLVLEAIERHDLHLPMLEAIRLQLEKAAREHGDEDMAAAYLASAPKQPTQP